MKVKVRGFEVAKGWEDKDIHIPVRKTAHSAGYDVEAAEDIVIPNNFIILRGIDMDKYSYIFVANYLEKIGIRNFVEENKFTGNLTLEDIKNIELPNIDKEKQMTISPLLKAINERSSIYSNILDNDEIIIKHAINKIIGEYHD